MGKLAVGLLGVWLIAALSAHGQAPQPGGTPMPTSDRVQQPGWWPTKGTPARAEYAGPAACEPCHAAKAASQITTPMAQASTAAADSKILRAHPRLGFHLGRYDYQIMLSPQGSLYSVTDGAVTVSAPLSWAFGVGQVGQTYVYEQNGNFFESRLSYYKNSEALDFSPGHPRSAPSKLENALGRPLDVGEPSLCFGCHATAATTSQRFDPSRLIPGVTCEACHGPGGNHVAAMSLQPEERGATFILNPARLKPVESVEFCGACHRTAWDVALAGSKGIFNLRFQPYRLETSRCWGKGDARLTCVACHDPHQPLVHDLASYDERCLNCHVAPIASKVTHDRRGAVCPVATRNCASCHMPKYEIPGIHASFTDHRIRIVPKGAPYTD